MQSVCQACASGAPARAGAHEAPVTAAGRRTLCRCGVEIALHHVRPVVTEGGRIESLCPACADQGAGNDADRVSDPGTLEVEPPHRRSGWRRYALAAVVAGGLALLAAAARTGVPSPTAVANSFAPAAMASRGPVRQSDEARAAEAARVADALADMARTMIASGPDNDPFEEDFDLDELPPTIEDELEEGEEALEARLPTLLDWVFPVLGSDEAFPLKPSRRFGSHREGVQRTDCGRGHCGVDLDGPRGTPVAAVAWGEIVRIERRSNRRSGKYVRIQHPDYVYTSYMHLDAIARDLKVGDEIQPGDVIGTLGRTGIAHSAAHLHFTLEIPVGARFAPVDPTPYLRRAARLPAPDRERLSMGASAEDEEEEEEDGEGEEDGEEEEDGDGDPAVNLVTRLDAAE